MVGGVGCQEPSLRRDSFFTCLWHFSPENIHINNDLNEPAAKHGFSTHSVIVAGCSFSGLEFQMLMMVKCK
jgi:hypothetical protein